MTPLQLKILDHVREFVAVSGLSPSIREIAAWNGTGVGAAHEAVTMLIEGGLLARGPGHKRNLRVADQPDLRGIASDALAAELARRGVTLAALNPEAPRAYGRRVACAADSCGAAVQRGHLMCRQHWFALPADLRERILRSNAQRDERAFERAVTQARDLIDSGQWGRRA